MSQISARPGKKIHQVYKIDPGSHGRMPHPALGPSPQNHPAVVDDVPDNPDSKYPAH
ncbi:hypothetical protein A2U01_0119413, partial [Trifolium medium]|nr:hypothetical protein [Trifolium medium]